MFKGKKGSCSLWKGILLLVTNAPTCTVCVDFPKVISDIIFVGFVTHRLLSSKDVLETS